MTDKGKLLYLVNDAGYFLSHRRHLALHALNSGYEVHVATPGGARVREILELGFHFHEIPMSRREGGILQELSTIACICALYRKLKPDVVHHVALKSVLYGGIAARLVGVPAVASALMGLGHVFTGKGLKVALIRTVVKAGLGFVFRHRNHRLIVQNVDDRLRLVASGLIEPRKVALIRGSGVDIELFTSLPEPEGEVTVVLASRMLKSKGICEFVEAARLLKRRGVAARCVLVGDEDHGNPVSLGRAQLAAWHEAGEVEWWGRREDMHAVMAGSHLVCLPTAYGEGVPKVLIEAAACGRAIVTTDAPGCRDIVHHGVNGLLVPLHDAEALADSLEKLIREPQLRRWMGAAGREMVVREFSLARVNAETLEVYRELAGGGPQLTLDSPSATSI